MLQVILTVVHIAVSLVLIGVVLLQTGKRADLAGAFGGGGSQTAFGARGAATILTKLTTGSAILFMFTSIALSLMASHRGADESAIDVANPPPISAPATPDELPTGTLPEAGDVEGAVDQTGEEGE